MFVPVVLLTGAAKYLFVPLAMAVVFAMLASYFLSRTLVPTMVHYMLGPEVPIYAAGEGGHAAHVEGLNWVWRTHFRFNHHFERFRERYRDVLEWSLHHRKYVMVLFIADGGVLGIPGVLHRRRLLSVCGFRADAAARTSPRRHAH